MFGAVTIILIIIAVIAFGAIFWVMGAYNGLVKHRNRYKNAFAQIDVQLKRRHDLIPNLVEVAKKYMSHERDTLEAVIAARNSAEGARKGVSPDNEGGMKALMAAEGGLGASLGRLFAVSEGYPDLKANQNMMQLSEELTSTENKVGFSRQAYNDAVTLYNTKRETFPTNMIAGMFNFGEAVLFEVSDPGEREAVKVEF
ncbi:protein LemA [Rubritalea halochordaticola]|uniref:Protein LemA n=1 Tax=Rubritalea halochordaticola TaxID=714537 RepID=A0ABP9V192_9BACT